MTTRRFRSLSRSAWVICLLSFGAALGVPGEIGAEDVVKASPAIVSSLARPSEAELIEQLSAIGYLAGSQPAAEFAGVIQHDPRQAAQGLNMVTSGHGPVALLMDMEGVVLHEWRAEFETVFPGRSELARATSPRRNFWRDALLMPNGDIIVIWELYGLFKLDRDSRVLWAVPVAAHHEVQMSASGEIVHLQAERRMIPGIASRKAIEDFIVVRDSSGTELRRLAMSRALSNVNWQRLRRSFWVRGKERGYQLNEKQIYDPFHTNSLWLLSRADAAALGSPFSPGDALVSMAMLDTIAILDLVKGETRWSQQGPFGLQHGPRPTRDGGIVLFNNFLTADRSSVVTLDPRTRRVIREYTGPESEPLHSRRSGRVQVLTNGNTLVVETDAGRALETTPDGRVVWEFRSSFRVPGARSRVASLYSLERIDSIRAGWLGVGREDAAEQE